MRSFIASLRNLVLPFGATTGNRIILDSDNGKIQLYINDFLSAEMAPTTTGASAGGFISYGATFPFNTRAMLTSGSVVFDWIGADATQPAAVSAAASASTYTSLELSAGRRTAAEANPRIELISFTGQRDGVVSMGSDGDQVDVQNGGRSLGRGLVAQATVTHNSAGFTFTTPVITVPAVTFRAGRAYRLNVASLVNSSSGGTTVQTYLTMGSTGRILVDTMAGTTVPGAGDNSPVQISRLIRNTGTDDVTDDVVMSFNRWAGAGTILLAADVTNPATVWIEDIGAAADYPDVRTVA